MPKLTRRLPSHCLHKASGQAIVTLSGADHYLGPYGSEASRTTYDRNLAEWIAARCQPPPTTGLSSDATVDELFVRFWTHVKNGPPQGRCSLRHSAGSPGDQIERSDVASPRRL